jgi:hypothetical protein
MGLSILMGQYRHWIGDYRIKNRTVCFLMWGNPPQEVLLGFKRAGYGAGKYAGFGGAVEVGETIEAMAAHHAVNKPCQRM